MTRIRHRSSHSGLIGRAWDGPGAG
jgi:hypothetical protein